MARNFDEWLSAFRESIANYEYYIDFRKSSVFILTINLTGSHR